MPEVVIVGAGPVGVVLAALLANRGVEPVVLEARETEAVHSRAIGIHPPALDVLDRIGAAERIVDEGVLIERGSAYSRGRRLGILSFAVPGARHPYIVSIPQVMTQRTLDASLARRVPGAVRRGTRVTGVTRVSGRLLVHTDDGGDPLSARVLVGADGARSVVRAAAHARMAVTEYRDRYLMGDFADDGLLGSEAALFLEPSGVVESFPLPGGVRRWVAHWGRAGAPATAEGLARVILTRTAAVVDPSTVTMLSEFRPRRALSHAMAGAGIVLVGDAAHEVSPIGGQGMNLGWLDAEPVADGIAALLRTGDDTGLRRAGRARLAAARKAARLAEINMALGRPLPLPAVRVRDALIMAVARPPIDLAMARAFSMQA